VIRKIKHAIGALFGLVLALFGASQYVRHRRLRKAEKQVVDALIRTRQEKAIQEVANARNSFADEYDACTTDGGDE